MSEAIRLLHNEHVQLSRLLMAVEHQLGLFEQAERPDYEVLEGVLEYCQSFPDRYHHPKEDLILSRLRERDPAAAEAIGDLDGEHKELAELTGHFREAVGNVLNEIEMPRENFENVARHFLEFYRRHMDMEERQFFPAARKALTEADWAEIDAKGTNPDDPVFGAGGQEQFEELRQHLMAWEKESEASRG